MPWKQLLLDQLEDVADEERAEVRDALESLPPEDRELAVAESGRLTVADWPRVSAEKFREINEALDVAKRKDLLRMARVLGAGNPEGRVRYKGDGPAIKRQPPLTDRELRGLIRGEIRRRRLTDWSPPPAVRWCTYQGEHEGPAVDIPGRWIEPTSVRRLLIELRGLPRGSAVRAVGAGHSASAVAAPAGHAVDLARCRDIRLRPDEPAGDVVPATLLRPGVSGHLFRVAAGLHIWELNRALWDLGFSLPILGNYDGQQVGGVLCTGTHGSAPHRGPLFEMVRSVDLLAGAVAAPGSATLAVRPLRVEPTRGITDPALFAARHPDWELVQDDETFDAVRMSLGAMGIVVAMTVEVVPKFWMRETRSARSVDAGVGGALDPEATDWPAYIRKVAQEKLFLEYLWNPYSGRLARIERAPMHAEPDHLEVRWVAPQLVTARREGPTYTTQALGVFPPDAALALAVSVVLGQPDTGKAKPGKDKNTMVGRSWDVMLMGSGAWQPARTTDIAIPLDVLPQAVAAVGAVVKAAERPERLWSPVGIRFGRACDVSIHPTASVGWATPQHLTTDIVAMLEFPTPMIAHPLRQRASARLVHRIETLLLEQFGGRPHLGKRGAISSDLLRKNWPAGALASWRKVRRALDPAETFTTPSSEVAAVKEAP